MNSKNTLPESSPLVSVIMSVYNCENTVEESVRSILNQTYQNWEFIICDDASTDATVQRLAKLFEGIEGSKFKLISNGSNRRLAYSLNRCLEVSRGEFIARMDGDDISYPNRLEEQVEYLKQNPKVDLVGTGMRRFNEDGPGDILLPLNAKPDRWSLGISTRTPFAHATIMARREVFEKVGNYTVANRTKRAEDLDLWYKFFLAGLSGANIEKPLYWVREDAAAIRRRTPKTRFDGALIRLMGNWKLRYGPTYYLPAIVELVKVLLPYKLFDWHRDYLRKKTRN